MKKFLIATLVLIGVSGITMAQTVAKSKPATTKTASKLSIGNKAGSTNSVSSVSPTPKPATTSSTTTKNQIGKKHKARKAVRKTAKKQAKSNKAAIKPKSVKKISKSNGSN